MMRAVARSKRNRDGPWVDFIQRQIVLSAMEGYYRTDLSFTDADEDKVIAMLEAKGFKVGAVYRGKRYSTVEVEW